MKFIEVLIFFTVGTVGTLGISRSLIAALGHPFQDSQTRAKAHIQACDNVSGCDNVAIFHSPRQSISQLVSPLLHFEKLVSPQHQPAVCLGIA